MPQNAPKDDERWLLRQLDAMERRVKALETAPRAGNTSMSHGKLLVMDPATGNVIASLAGAAGGTDLSGNAVPAGLGANVGSVNGGILQPASVDATKVSFVARDLSGITTTTSASAPVSPLVGDLWIDTANGNVLKRWDGTTWAALPVGTNAIQAGSVTASQIAANTITAGNIAAGAITASAIAAGAVTAGKVAANAIDAMTITGATVITNSATGGFFVYSGTPATGNLIVSVASAAGTDAFSNSYPQGLNVTQGVISGTAINAATLTAGSLSSGNIGSSIIIGSDIQGGTIENATITFDSNGGALLVYASTTTTQTFTTTGTGSFTVPAGVTSLQVECWGAGAGGAGGSNPSFFSFGGAGGGGGGYAKVNALAVTPGNSYAYVVGAGGSGGGTSGAGDAGNNGGNSSFNSTDCVAVAGNRGGTGGGSPLTGANVGDVTFVGGDSSGTGSTGASGGGGSAGPNSSGHKAPSNSGTGAGAGGTAVTGGGAGGAGGSAGAHNGSAGGAPGGGGGGGGGGTSLGSGGSGARGQVKVTYLSGRSLIASISGLAGTDAFGNSYPAGISGVIGSSLFAAKSADESVTSSITLQNDDHLVIPVAAGATYTIDGYLQWVGNDTGDIKFAFAFPASATLHWGMVGPDDTVAAFASGGTRGAGEWFAKNNQTTSPTGAIQYSASTAALTGRMSGLLVTGASAGNLQLQWAQFVSNATATTLLKGSWLRLQRVA